jgi:hypothetical protein
MTDSSITQTDDNTQSLFKGEAPVWASTEASDTESLVAASGKPMATWATNDIFSEGNYSAAVVRDDEYEPETDTTSEGKTVLAIYGNDSDHLDEPDTIRRIGFGILKAADSYEDIVTEIEPLQQVTVYDRDEVLYHHVEVGSVFPGVTITANKETDAYNVYVSGLDGKLFTPSETEFLCIEILRAARIAERLNEVAR